MEVRQKPWGKEILYIDEPEYVMKMLKFKKLGSTSKSYHPKKKETLYILKGELNLRLYNCRSGRNFRLKKGDTKTINPGKVHVLTGITECIVIEVSTQPKDEKVRVNG